VKAAAALMIATVGTFALRALSVRAFAARDLDPRFGLALRDAALAIIAALVVRSLPHDADTSALQIPALAGIAVAVVAGRRQGNLAVVILLAVATYTGAVAVGLG
jgi:branched-subunit amino acid transport protein